MARENLNDLLAFLMVAREKSFTRAAAKLGVSQSALSHTVRGLESRMGITLLTRTTRSVSTTEAGERLLLAIGPRIEEIETELDALTSLRDKPAGTIRISCTDHAADTVLWPVLREFLPMYPDIKVEVSTEYGFVDIVAEKFNAGVRYGELVGKDMVAVRIGPDTRMAAVGTPSYFARRPVPKTPQALIEHDCINLRFTPQGGLYAWEFEKAGREIAVRVEGRLVFSGIYPILEAVLDGFGLAYLPIDIVEPHIASGRLRHVLGDWCPPFSGYHLYYPSRQTSPAFKVLVDALRYRPK
jgi:DNA-binding transcriptional LysR family regulator